MHRLVQCWFGRKGTDDRRYEDHIVYHKSAPDVPKYIPYEDLPDYMPSVPLGTYIETKDGWITPIIGKYKYVFRVAANRYSAFNPFLVADRKQEVYFDPPIGATNSHRMRDSNLSKQQIKFCQVYVETGDFLKAFEAAGYRGRTARNRLRSPKIRKGIMAAFRDHLKKVHKNEEDFLSKRITKANEIMDKALDAVIARVEEGTATEEDHRLLKQCLDNNNKLMGFSASLLGYDTPASKRDAIPTGATEWSYQLPEGVQGE